MSHALRVDPRDAVPIWRQIEDGVRRLVAAGALSPGATVPSVRDLARDLRVNPATVSKAYQRLTDAGILEVRRGEGTFVAAAPPAMARSERTRTLREAASRYAAIAVTLGAKENEAVEQLRNAWSDVSRPLKGGDA
ncbi:MAG: GntR family transcriptional regulator [Vicinamibacteria bacterium]